MNISSGGIRFGGLATGLDTDSMVKDLMRAERMSLDKIEQQKQVAEWTRDEYREITGLLRDFQNDYLDTLSSSNMLSRAMYTQFSASSSNNSIVTAIASGDVVNMNNNMTVKRLATAARGESASNVSETEKLSLSDDLAAINSKLADDRTFNFEGGMTLTIKNGEADAVDIDIAQGDTLRTIINKVNSSSAGVRMSYSSFADKFVIESTNTGDKTITLDDNESGFFSAIQLTDSEMQAGQDALFDLNGVEAATRDTNVFTIDGVTYTLHSESEEEAVNISLDQNVQGVYDAVESFVNAYNNIIDTLNGKLSEGRHRDFLPLTEEQKGELSEREVEQWEEKARSGMLRNDPALQRIAGDMRRAMYDGISGVTGGIYDIGISTSRYSNGRLEIDENRLKAAIAENPDRVANIFTQQSETYAGTVGARNLTSEQRQIRYGEQGLAFRLYDLVQDNVSTMRDSNGQRGRLLQRAGMVGNTSETDNFMYRQIQEFEKQMQRMNERLISKESNYYRQFAALEKAMSKMNSQADWLHMQLMGGF